MNIENRAFIGITDFTHQSEVDAMRRILDDAGSTRLLAVGVMMSYKTLREIETKWALVFPPKEKLAKIFVRREGVMNVLHYADYDGQTTLDDLAEALEWAGPGVDAIQLDMIWPDPHMLYELRRIQVARGNLVKFIIQVNRPAMEACENDPEKVAQKLNACYRMACLDYALYDLSGGTGKSLDANRLLPFIFAAERRMPSCAHAVAGGLGPSTLELLEPLLATRTDISIDAQSRLRPSGDALHPVDWDMAGDYVRRAALLFAQYEHA